MSLLTEPALSFLPPTQAPNQQPISPNAVNANFNMSANKNDGNNNETTQPPKKAKTDNDKTTAPTPTVPRIDDKKPVASTKWLALETWVYTDEEGKQRQWDVATRTTKPKLDVDAPPNTPGNTRSEADAVVIIPILKSKTSPSNKLETLLVEQYRPPIQQYTMEFPAGLVDAGETVEQAALRELREETGFVGERCSVVPDVSRAVCMSPGLATETVHVVLVQVDLDNPYNHGTPKPDLDDGEHVKLHRVHLDEGIKALLDQCPAMPIMGLYLFAMGFQLGVEQQKAANEKQSTITNGMKENGTK